MSLGSGPSHRILGAVLTGRPEPAESAGLTGADWERLVEIAHSERVAPLLYHRLEESGWPEAMPAPSRRKLRGAYFGAGGLNLLIYEELGRILAAIRAHLPTGNPLKVVLLKGASLAATVYPNIALRTMCDLDLLLPRDVLQEAVTAVRSLGYGDVSPEIIPGYSQEILPHIALRGGPGGHVTVELHWGLIGGRGDVRAPDLDWFWEQTELCSIEAVVRGSGLPPALELSPTAHLLYLAAHATLQHARSETRLLWLYDLHLLSVSCGDRLDWDELVHRSRLYRWTPALYAALERTHRILRTPLPQGLLQTLAAEVDRDKGPDDRHRPDPRQSRADDAWNSLRFLDWPRRRRLVRSILWPTPDYVRWRYGLQPKWLWPLCYPYRWTLAAIKGLPAIMRWARRRLLGRIAVHGGAE